MGKFIVYKITNKINGKLYFGITKVGIKKRWIQHKCNSTRKNYHLYRAIIKYGFDNFIIEIVKNCNTDTEMYELERKMIADFKTNDSLYGYNNSTGGEISSFGSKRTIEQRQKISNYQKVRKRKPFTKETILKMKQTAKGRDMSKAIAASILKTKGKIAHNIVGVFSVSNNNDISHYKSITEASEATGILITSIHNNLSNKSKTAGGLKWYYKQRN